MIYCQFISEGLYSDRILAGGKCEIRVDSKITNYKSGKFSAGKDLKGF